MKTFSYQDITRDDLRHFCILSCLVATPPLFIFYVFFIVTEHLCSWSREPFCPLKLPDTFAIQLAPLSCGKYSCAAKALIFLPGTSRHQCPKSFIDLLEQSAGGDLALSSVWTRGSPEGPSHLSYSECQQRSQSLPFPMIQVRYKAVTLCSPGAPSTFKVL